MILITRNGINKVLQQHLIKLKTSDLLYATVSGTTWGLDDIQIPEEKYQVIDVCNRESKRNYESIFKKDFFLMMSDIEKLLKSWHGAKNDVEKLNSRNS
jgi:hypothetical protein